MAQPRFQREVIPLAGALPAHAVRYPPISNEPAA
jgi:hypothetical protein